MTTETREERLEAVRADLAPPWAEREERVVEAGAFRSPSASAGIGTTWRTRARRSRRPARALGASSDWLPLAEKIVAEAGFNVNRRGVVFVPAVQGRDLAALAVRLSASADAVHAAVLETA